MTEVIFTALTLQQLEAFLDKRLDLAFQRNVGKSSASQDNVPGQAAPPHVSKKEAARLLSCSQSSISNYARAGQLRRFYLGKSVRFERREVLGMAQAHTNTRQQRAA